MDEFQEPHMPMPGMKKPKMSISKLIETIFAYSILGVLLCIIIAIGIRAIRAIIGI